MTLLWGTLPKWQQVNTSLQGLDFHPDGGSNRSGLLYAEWLNGETFFSGGRELEDLYCETDDVTISDLSRFAL